MALLFSFPWMPRNSSYPVAQKRGGKNTRQSFSHRTDRAPLFFVGQSVADGGFCTCWRQGRIIPARLLLCSGTLTPITPSPVATGRHSPASSTAPSSPHPGTPLPAPTVCARAHLPNTSPLGRRQAEYSTPQENNA